MKIKMEYLMGTIKSEFEMMNLEDEKLYSNYEMNLGGIRLNFGSLILYR